MRRFAFAIALIGLFILAVLLALEPLKVDDPEDLENFEANKKVFVEGRVVEGRVLSSGTKVLNLDNGIILVCACSGNFKGKIVFAEGFISVFNDKRQVTALRIFTNDN